MLPGIVTQNNIEDDATSLSWFALACFLTDVILLSTKGAKYSINQGSIPDKLLLRLLTDFLHFFWLI